MKKKVLIILPSFAMGGAENMVYELSNHINPRNFDVSVLCYCGKQNTSLEKKAEDRIEGPAMSGSFLSDGDSV